MTDFTVTVADKEWFVAFFADMIDFIFAAKNRVRDANIVVQTVAVAASSTDGSGWVCETGTIFDGFFAGAYF